MTRALPVLLGLAAMAAELQAQESRRCRFRVPFVGDSGRQVASADGTNYFAGGGVIITCDGTSVRIRSDSVAAYGGKVVQFIGKVRYSDSTVTMEADNGTYFKDGERWEARGNVVTTNLLNGSTLTGPSLDYFRVVKGVRDSAEVYAVGRPTIKYVTKDSSGKAQEPYVIVGDRVRQKGETQVWAGGKVTVDRSDLATRSDSLALRTGKGGAGALVGGSPTLKATGKDTLDLAGRRIDFTLDDRALTGVMAQDSGRAVMRDVDLVGDSISIALKEQKAELTLAWGRNRRPVAVTKDYELRGDSLVIESPDQKLRQVRGYRGAWAGAKPDSASQERDWVAGDTVIVRFAERDSAGKASTKVSELEAVGTGKSFYRTTDKDKKDAKPSLNYARADRIVIRMRSAGDDGVERVDFFGNVDGVQLEPDSTAGRAKATTAKPAVPTFTRPTLPGLPGGQSGGIR